MWTWPVVIIVSTATRLRGSCSSIASRIESLIWSAILSGWPSVTDSDVKRRRDTRSPCDRRPSAAVASGDGWARRLRLPAPGQPGGDGVPDAGRDDVLAPGGQRGDGPVVAQHRDLVLGPAEHPTGGDVVD